MTYLYMPSGGCIHTKGMRIGDPAEAVHWDPGVYARMEYAQITSPTHMPSVYTGQAGTVYKLLDTETWLKGVSVYAFFGDIVTGAANGDGETGYDWTTLDDIFRNVRENLSTPYAKKVMLMLSFKVTEIANATRLLPDYSDFRSTSGSGNYADEGSITNGADCPEYAYLWGYRQNTTGKGYHYYLRDFRDGLSGNDLAGNPIYTFRDRYYQFLEDLANRYANHPDNKDIFAGIITSESASLNSIDGSVVPNDTSSGGNNERNYHFLGRLALLKKLKTIFTKHLVADDCNFDTNYVQSMSGHPTTSDMFINKIACTASDWHTGQSLTSIYNFKTNFSGVLPSVGQVQPDTMESMTHNEDDYWAWSEGSPTVKGDDSTGGNVHAVHNEPTGAWIMSRAINYFQNNYLLYQYNKTTANGTLPDSGAGHVRFNFDSYVTYMRSSPYADMEHGGLNTTRSTYIA